MHYFALALCGVCNDYSVNKQFPFKFDVLLQQNCTNNLHTGRGKHLKKASGNVLCEAGSPEVSRYMPRQCLPCPVVICTVSSVSWLVRLRILKIVNCVQPVNVAVVALLLTEVVQDTAGGDHLRGEAEVKLALL